VTLNEINDRIRIQSNSTFIFGRAQPLVELVNNLTVKPVGPNVRYNFNFMERMNDLLTSLGKVINVKFDYFDKQLLDYVKNYGCRGFCFTSDIIDEQNLCIEGKMGELKTLSKQDLINYMKPNKGKLNIDTVVVGIP
jgi:hypothetical protein